LITLHDPTLCLFSHTQLIKQAKLKANFLPDFLSTKASLFIQSQLKHYFRKNKPRYTDGTLPYLYIS